MAESTKHTCIKIQCRQYMWNCRQASVYSLCKIESAQTEIVQRNYVYDHSTEEFKYFKLLAEV